MIKLSLKGARVNAGYSQKDAAEKLGVSNATLCSWENGESFPNVKYVDKICELYGVSYDDISFLPNDSLKAKNGG